MTSFVGLAAKSPSTWSSLEKIEFTPKPVGPHDVDVKIEACGICSLDLHTLKAEWAGPSGVDYPVIAGHEIVGRVTLVGPEVTLLKVGDRVGIGAQVFSCLKCPECGANNEQHCTKAVLTYNSSYEDGSKAWGGYALGIRAHEHFCFPIPDGISLVNAAPMFCAGLTVYSPLVRNGCTKGSKVGVIGLGGLGHYAVLWAKALGAEVTVFSRTDAKKEDALKMGADHFVATQDGKPAFERIARSLDLIIGTANLTKNFNLGDYLLTLKVNGKYVSVGLPADGKFEVSTLTFLRNACFFGSSFLGTRKEALDMLKLAEEKNIQSWVEEIPINEENAKKALERMEANDVKYRFVFTEYEKAFGN